MADENMISNIISAAPEGAPWMSIEFFPPKTETGIRNLFEALAHLKEYGPKFVDFTWGAGGSTSDLTFDLCLRAKTEFNVTPNMHLTCTNMEMSKIDVALERCKSNNIVNIFALRGDAPAGQGMLLLIQFSTSPPLQTSLILFASSILPS